MTVCIKSLIKNLNVVIGCPVGCPYCYARCTCRRFHVTEDFDVPEYYPNKLRLLGTGGPRNLMMTGMSDLAFWRPEWRDEVLSAMADHPDNSYVFLTKRPDILELSTDLDCAWIGVTVNGSRSVDRIADLRRNVDCRHYHVTFEPLFDHPGEVDLEGIEWIVIGTETGRRKGKAVTDPKWAESLLDQASAAGVPAFMKEDLLPIMGEERMVQELPAQFIKPGIQLDTPSA